MPFVNEDKLLNLTLYNKRIHLGKFIVLTYKAIFVEVESKEKCNHILIFNIKKGKINMKYNHFKSKTIKIFNAIPNWRSSKSFLKHITYYFLLLICCLQKLNAMDDEGINERTPLMASATPSVRVAVADDLTSGTAVRNWLEHDIIDKLERDIRVMTGVSPLRRTNPEKSVLVIESISGLARGAVYVKLGYILAERVVSSISSPGKEILSSLYAAGASAPMVCLGARSSGRVLTQLISKKSINEINVEERTANWRGHVWTSI